MLSTGSLPRPDLSDRRTRLSLGIAVMGALFAAFVYTIGTGDVRLTVLVAGLAVAPALLVLALKRSYLFPYGIYVVLIPFDNMLKISGSGTLTKMLGVLSTLFIMVYAFRRKGINPPPFSLYVWLAYLAWLLISLLWSADVQNGLLDAQTTVSLIGMFAVLSVAPVEERDLRAICTCIVLGGIASSFYGMYLLHDQPAMATMGGETGRLMINVDNRTIDANHFANAMVTPIALSLVALLNSRKLLVILGSIFALVVLFAGELMSLSREAMLACAVVIVITVFFSRRRVLGFAVGAGILGLVPVFVPTIGARITDAIATGGAGRTGIWETGLAAFKIHPFFGWGAGGAIEAYDRTYLHVFQFYNAGWGRPPHNTPLQAAVELGVVGLFLLALAYVTTFRQFRGIRRGDDLYDLRIAFTASLIGLGICSLFIGLQTYKYLWIALATTAQLRTVALSRRRAPAPAVVYEPPPAPVPAPAPRAQRRRYRRDPAPAAP
ncbi:MAG TPA: O-antigen ligase family protein [Candidatus Elarobacter sp.]|nr:O-antigen ligase family protein [Candidatus Elarobacter sp.]